MRFVIGLIAAVFSVAGSLSGSLASAQENLAPPAIEDFVGPLDYWGAELSPNGKHLAPVRRQGSADYLIVYNLEPGSTQPKPVSVGDYYVDWLEWANDDRLLVAATGYIDIKTGRQVKRKDFEEETSFYKRAEIYSFRRLISVQRETQEMAVMFGDDWRMNRSFSLGNVTDFLPDDDKHILMPARLNGDLDLFKVNVEDGTFERVAIGSSGTALWYTDRTGEPAFRIDLNRRGTVATIYAHEDHSSNKTKWRKTRTIRIDQDDRDESAKDFEILYPGPTVTTYYVNARSETDDRSAIYLYDFEKDELVEKFAEHERVDMSDGFFNRVTRELMGVYYIDDRLMIRMQNAETQAHLDALSEYFGETMNVLPLDSSSDGKRWLLQTTGPEDPGSYHLFSFDTASNMAIATQKVSLAGKRLASSRRIDYEARDGTKLHGYLTRPAGVADDVPLPLVVMPHGGPESRSAFTFDWKIQVLASKGYQVFEPNFRGSSGFGKKFADLGRGEWGGAMQTDVEDGYAYLVKQGLAEQGRACIYGYSYGGYSALVAATLTPDLYACIIAGAGPSDLLEMLDWERKEEGRDSEAYLYWVEHIGNPSKDKDKLAAVSPARLASRVTRPIMLIHGEQDGIVPIMQSELMEKALRKAGKSYEFLRLPDSAHSYRSDEDELREYQEAVRFLQTYLPVN